MNFANNLNNFNIMEEYLIRIQVPSELSQSGAEYLRAHIDVLLEFLYGEGIGRVTAILHYD